MVRSVVYGRTAKQCQQNVDAKIRGGWVQITGIKLDDAYIGGRFVSVMELQSEKHYKEKDEKARRFLGQL